MKRSLEDLGKSNHDDSMSKSKDLGDMKHDRKAIDDELAHELGLSSESHAVKRHGESAEDLVVGHGHEHVEDMEVDGSEYLDTEVAMTSSNVKRESEVPLVELEEEIRKETETDNLKRSIMFCLALCPQLLGCRNMFLFLICWLTLSNSVLSRISK